MRMPPAPRDRARALIVGDRVLAITIRESRALFRALSVQAHALGAVLDGDEPLSDERDHELRRELAALGRVAHMLRTGEAPLRDTPALAEWRAQTVRKIEARMASTSPASASATPLWLLRDDERKAGT